MLEHLSIRRQMKNGKNYTVNAVIKHEAGLEAPAAEYDPWKERNVTHPLGVAGALFHLLKGSLGSGVLSTPAAFRNAGLWTGLAGTLFAAALYTHCVHILVVSCHELVKRVKQPTLGFGQIAEAAFATGPSRCRPFAPAAKGCVDVLFLGYYLCCVVYLLFTANSLEQVVQLNTGWELDSRLYVLVVTTVALPLGMIRDLKYLVPFSLLAVSVLMVGCGFVLYEVFQDLPPLSSRPAFSSIDRLPIFFSMILYALDGIGTVFPIENSMRNPKYFLGCPGVLNVTLSWLAILYCVVGFFGYLRYGEAVQATITLNISSSVLGQVVKMMVTLNVLCSYGLFFYVPTEIIWKKLQTKINPSRHTFCFYTMKMFMIIGTVVLAVVVPDMEVVVSLVGAVSASSMILLFPPVIELLTFWQQHSYLNLLKILIIILLWVVVLVTGLWLSILDIIKLYQ